MATYTTSDPIDRRARSLVLSLWVMPIVAGVAVLAVAAGMLIETLVLANSIDAKVTPIRSSLADIKLHTDTIAVLNTVDASAKGIKSAAHPLTDQAASILGVVSTIQSTVGSIDGSAGSIDSHVAAVDGTVGSITSGFTVIRGQAISIDHGLGSAVSLADQVLGVLGTVKGDTGRLLVTPLLPTINDHANSIDCKLGSGGACQ
jgi:hypothetical protein